MKLMKQTFHLTIGEEIGNAISHGVMALIVLFTLPYFVIRAYLQYNLIGAIGISIYFFCLFFMFAGSCLYHIQPYDTTYKLVFRKLDHIMILLAIAGTYTPICLIMLHQFWILALEWTMVLAGILLKAIAKESHMTLSLIIYLVMGWLAILILPSLLARPLFFGLILAGGLLYTIGVYFYSKPQKPYFHFIWHLFIIFASLAHAIAILYFL